MLRADVATVRFAVRRWDRGVCGLRVDGVVTAENVVTNGGADLSTLHTDVETLKDQSSAQSGSYDALTGSVVNLEDDQTIGGEKTFTDDAKMNAKLDVEGDVSVKQTLKPFTPEGCYLFRGGPILERIVGRARPPRFMSRLSGS